jgi:hypothetical protein
MVNVCAVVKENSVQGDEASAASVGRSTVLGLPATAPGRATRPERIPDPIVGHRIERMLWATIQGGVRPFPFDRA